MENKKGSIAMGIVVDKKSDLVLLTTDANTSSLLGLIVKPNEDPDLDTDYEAELSEQFKVRTGILTMEDPKWKSVGTMRVHGFNQTIHVYVTEQRLMGNVKRIEGANVFTTSLSKHLPSLNEGVQAIIDYVILGHCRSLDISLEGHSRLI